MPLGYRGFIRPAQVSRRDVVAKLARLGIRVKESHIFTCAMATARFLAAQKPGGTAYVIGEGRAVTYEMVETAIRMVMRGARKELGLDASRTTMIGDTMETDILGGVQLGYRTILVLSGGTRREDLGAFAYRPDMVVESIAGLSAAVLAGLAAGDVV